MTGKAAGARTPRRAAATKKTQPEPDPDLVVVDLNDFTAAEIEAIEELTGTPITHASDLEKPQGAILRAMGWVTRVRDDDATTTPMPYEADGCERNGRPRCPSCWCSRRLKVGIRVGAPEVPPSGGNGS